MSKKIILSAGGTGGHVFPAQAVAKTLQNHAELLFVAANLSQNPFFDRSTFAFEEIAAATLGFSNPFTMIRNGVTILKGVAQALKIIDRFNPNLVIGFGSFYSVPMLLAAKIKKIPFILHEQNVKPGRVNYLFSKWAQATAITFAATAKQLKGPSILVEFPMREHPPLDAWQYFGWQPGQKVILICGGSQGAKRLNQLAPHTHGYRIIHIVGRHGDPEHVAKQYRMHHVTAIVKNFEPRMDLAQQIADLAIARAGAAMVCELIASQTPAILVPFPHARDNHQLDNAQFFTEEAGGGIIITEENLDDKALYLAISTLDLKACRDNLRNFQAKQQKKNFTDFILSYL